MKFPVNLFISIVSLLSVFACCNSRPVSLNDYWKDLDISEVENVPEVEVKFENYLKLLESAPKDSLAPSIHTLLDKLSSNMVWYNIIATWVPNYLHIADSPQRNDAVYAVFVDKIVSDGKLDFFQMENYRKAEANLHKNRIGDKVENIDIEDEEGVKTSLSSFTGTPLMIILFDSECYQCINYIRDSSLSEDANGRKAVAIGYRSNRSLTKAIKSKLPSSVYVGFCPSGQLDEGFTFDLTMLPSRLLIDADGFVEKSYY